MDVYFQPYVVGCEFIFVIFFNSRNKICHKKEREVMMQWQNVKVCPGEVFIFVARPQMSYLANCHYFSKLPFPLPSWDGPLLNNLKKTMERGGFPHLDACNLDMGYLVLYLDMGKRSKDSDTTLCSNCKGCVPAIKAFIAKV